MPDPKTSTKQELSLANSTVPGERQAKPEKTFAEEIKAREFAPQIATPRAAQLIISLDLTGTLICEGPGAGGASRQKVEGVVFDDLPHAIQAALIQQRDRLAAIHARVRLDAPKPTSRKVEREDAEVARHKENARIATARAEAYARWLESLTESDRQVAIAKRERIAERRRELELEAAKTIWITTATRHGVKLANRVVGKDRRPKAAKKINSVTRTAPVSQVDPDLAIRGKAEVW